jgi:hypothetical protein
MICADFLAGANLENETPGPLAVGPTVFQVPNRQERQTFLQAVTEKTS